MGKKKSLKERAEQAFKEVEKKHERIRGIRERLMRRLLYRVVEVEFEDDQGKFTIPIRLLSPAERRRLFEIQYRFTQLQNEINRVDKEEKLNMLREELERIDDEICRFLEKICIDPDLDFEFWKRGEGFSMDVPAKLLSEAIRLSPSTDEEIKLFRRVK